MGDDFVIKYYLVQMHYDNPKEMAGTSVHVYSQESLVCSCLHLGRQDSSGIRFYIGNERRQHDLGYLTFGTDSFVLALAIPPRADRFIVDSYCPSELTQASDLYSPPSYTDNQSIAASAYSQSWHHSDFCIPTYSSTRYRDTVVR